MAREKYSFELTLEQQVAIRDMCISDTELFLSGTGMVCGCVFGDYEITFYTFREDGSVVREVRDFLSDGWTIHNIDVDGVWRDELGEVVEVG